MFDATICAVLVLLCAATLPVEGKFLTATEREDGQCYSATGSYVELSVITVPSSAIDFFETAKPVAKYEFVCIEASEDPPTLPVSQAELCQQGYAIQICTSLADLKEKEWKCQTYPEYAASPESSVVLGALNGPLMYVKVQWKSLNIGTFCFPRDVTIQFVAHELKSPRSNVAANVAFIVIVVLVGLLLLFFLSYQLRKVWRKFMKRDERADKNALSKQTMVEQTMKALGDGSGKVPLSIIKEQEQSAYNVDVYGESITAPGVQMTVMEDATVLTSKPLPKPWFHRVDYSGNEADPRQEQQRRRAPSRQRINSPNERKGATSRTPQHQKVNFSELYETDVVPVISVGGGEGPQDDDESADPNFYSIYDDIDRHPNGAARLATQVAAPSVGDEADDDVVLTCTDCMMPIRGAATPQLCAVTGKRHY